MKGYFGEDIDIDVAFICAKEVKSYDLYLGQVIYSDDPKEPAEFKIRTLKEYALLNEERAEILRNISARGSVYGG